jgi:GntR family transcriptional regulator, transcriptional repressor for pyruvate dehydrogenase complex
MDGETRQEIEERSPLEVFPSRDKSLTAVETVVETIKGLLIEKKLRPGDLLPSENEIASSLSISRGSIREAMKILDAFGVVEIRRGNGTFVATQANRKLFDPLLFNLLVTQPEIEELAEFRLMVEEGILALAARNAEEADFRELERICDGLEDLEREGGSTDDALLAHDREFHAALGESTHNRLVANLYDFVIGLLAPTMHPAHGQSTHRRIASALKAKDLDAALSAIRAHDEIWRSLNLPRDVQGEAGRGGKDE